MKFLLNPITKQKIANFQNTLRRFIIILLSSFSLFIVRVSIWMPYSKNIAEPRYDQKNNQFAKYWHTPLNACFHLVFWCLLSNRYFGTLTLKFLLNDDQFVETMTNLQNTVKRLEIIVTRRSFAADDQSDILELLLWNVPRTPLWPKIWLFAKHCQGLSFTVFEWSICAYHVSNILESLLWNFYLTKLRLTRWPVWKILSHAS